MRSSPLFELFADRDAQLRRGRRGPLLLHQTAINPSLPERESARIFHERLKRQAPIFCGDSIRFMRRRELERKSSEPVRRVGLGIYAIEERPGPPVRWRPPRNTSHARRMKK